MLAWRKKPDGFEWHKYIRTTVKLRREARRERVHQARHAAGQHMSAAGAALAAGSRAAGSAARDGAVAGAGALGLGVQALWSLLIYGLRTAARPIVEAVARPNIGGPVVLAGGIAVGAGIGRWRGIGLDQEAAATLAIGIVLMSALVPMLAAATGWRMPRLSAAFSGRGAAMVLGLVALVGGAAWFATGAGLPNVASVANLPLIGGGKTVRGRAYASGADTLRIEGRTVRLAGIDAPEAEQRCGRGRGARCGAAAETALSRLVGRRSVTCTLSGSDPAGRPLGQCSAGDRDIAAELVRQGYAFAGGGILASYASQEREARAAKAGVWAADDVERPAAFRARVWDEAKRRAPDGCPIKGQVSGGSRVYVLPWAPDYDRARVQRSRGERWFCSEQEALAAGFRAGQGG
jgi:endonuclease YncB( thermonuclease family)